MFVPRQRKPSRVKKMFDENIAPVLEEMSETVQGEGSVPDQMEATRKTFVEQVAPWREVGGGTQGAYASPLIERPQFKRPVIRQPPVERPEMPDLGGTLEELEGLSPMAKHIARQRAREAALLEQQAKRVKQQPTYFGKKPSRR